MLHRTRTVGCGSYLAHFSQPYLAAEQSVSCIQTDRCYIKYFGLFLLFVSIEVFACRDPIHHGKHQSDIFRDAIEDDRIIVVGTVADYTCYIPDKVTNRAFKDHDVCYQILTIEVNKTFNGVPKKNYNLGLGRNSSCDSGDFHPTKSISTNGSSKKVTNYQVGKEYLFIIYERERDNKKYNYVRAGEILGTKTLPYINKYTEYNTANKSLKQDK
ncbi:hypothetical protein [Colwellia sp. E2M01]|uniref:hypothetical protein n=1 Tax=Colwellia sp. E2M01 TaxID=2841561 RepID=UPI001C0A1A95|nr:hypothetical protein [Colwellia sp. E2M01]MBU2870530.1 hypothetical protein [Colwellia sp. E2M01]